MADTLRWIDGEAHRPPYPDPGGTVEFMRDWPSLDEEEAEEERAEQRHALRPHGTTLVCRVCQGWFDDPRHR